MLVYTAQAEEPQWRGSRKTARSAFVHTEAGTEVWAAMEGQS